MNADLKNRIKFFLRAGIGYSTPPGRMECAKSLAQAEIMADEYNLVAEWEDDYDADTSWMDKKQLAEFEAGTLIPFCLRIWNADKSEVLSSLSGIFLYDAKDNDDTKRVYEAECFSEAMAAIMTGNGHHCSECSGDDEETA